MRVLIAATTLIAACSPAVIGGQGRETAGEIRRILAHAICLAEAYPATPIASDSAAVVAAYQGSLGTAVTVRDLDAVRNLAKAEKPATPTPVGNRNFGIARCVLFADRAEVLKLLGERGRTDGKP